jgi:hypothetical protein
MIALCPCYIYISFSVFIYAYRAKKRGGYRTSHEEMIFIAIDMCLFNFILSTLNIKIMESNYISGGVEVSL